MLLLQGMKIIGVKTVYIYLKVYRKYFKDISCALEFSHGPKRLPCTKHINIDSVLDSYEEQEFV